jgi:hypothetical protein
MGVAKRRLTSAKETNRLPESALDCIGSISLDDFR